MVPGRLRWVIPDGFLPELSQGAQISHESVCVLNLGKDPATVRFTFYWENEPPRRARSEQVDGERARHIRLDRIVDEAGQPLPRGVPYAVLVDSDRPVIVQHTRLDTSQPALALMTAMAYPLPDSEGSP